MHKQKPMVFESATIKLQHDTVIESMIPPWHTADWLSECKLSESDRMIINLTLNALIKEGWGEP